MADRRQILDLFEQQREETEQRIADGIERYRKGDAVITLTGEKGILSFRGFYGEYKLEIEQNGKTVTKTVQLSPKQDNKITVIV